MDEIHAEGLGYLCAQAKEPKRAYIPEIENNKKLLAAFNHGYTMGVSDLKRGKRATPQRAKGSTRPIDTKSPP